MCHTVGVSYEVGDILEEGEEEKNLWPGIRSASKCQENTFATSADFTVHAGLVSKSCKNSCDSDSNLYEVWVKHELSVYIYVVPLYQTWFTEVIIVST